MIDEKLLEKFLKIAAKKLTGEWILLGGSLLSLLKIQQRVTYDIDIVEIQGRTQDINLMQIAEDLNLPIESINQAANFFIEKIPKYELKLILIEKNEHFKLYRPNLELYLELKMKRATKSDIEDCKLYIEYCIKNDNIPSKEVSEIYLKYPNLLS